MSTTRHCEVCGAELPYSGRGRPRTACATGCAARRHREKAQTRSYREGIRHHFAKPRISPSKSLFNPNYDFTKGYEDYD